MNKDKIRKVRQLVDEGCSSIGIIPAISKREALAILDAALAADPQQPVGCQHNRYSVDVHEQIGHCIDCGAEGRMRFVVAAPEPQPVAWRVWIGNADAFEAQYQYTENGDGEPLYTAPAATPQREYADHLTAEFRKELDALSQRNYELRLENAALKAKNTNAARYQWLMTADARTLAYVGQLPADEWSDYIDDELEKNHG